MVGIFVNRKNVIVILMALELILLSVNINLVAFSTFLGDIVGQVFAHAGADGRGGRGRDRARRAGRLLRNRGSIAVEDINHDEGLGMIRKSVKRFSEKIMRNKATK